MNDEINDNKQQPTDVIFFEAIETEDGRFILRTGDTKEIIFLLQFAPNTNHLLNGVQDKIAKVMIEVGVQMVGKAIEQNRAEGFISHTIH